MNAIFDAIIALNWIEITKAATGLATLCVAKMALDNWKHQGRAQKKTEVLDNLTSSIQELVPLLERAATQVWMIKISIESYSGTIHLDKDKLLQNPEAVAYIIRQGREDSAELHTLLRPCGVTLAKIRTHVVKAAVFDLVDYAKCESSCAALGRVYLQMDALRSVIARSSHNWENPSVQRTLSAVLKIDADELNTEIKTQHSTFIEFAKSSYRAAYT